jgi:hypothetical protein
VRKTTESRDTFDTDIVGYPAGRISGKSESRISDIRPDFGLKIQMYVPVPVEFEKIIFVLFFLTFIQHYFQHFLAHNSVTGRISKQAGLFGKISGRPDSGASLIDST